MKKIFLIAAAAAVALCGCGNNSRVSEKKAEEGLSDELLIAAAEAEMNGINKAEYIDSFIEQTSIKRAVLLAFDSYDECAAFINEYGADVDPAQKGGVSLSRQTVNGESFFNPIGTELESVYDSLEDGAYFSEPILYREKYCYLRRTGNLQTAAESIDEIFGKEITLTVEEGVLNEK